MLKFKNFLLKKQKNKARANDSVQWTPAGSGAPPAPPAGAAARPGRHRKASRRILTALAALLLLLLIWGISTLAVSLIRVRSVELTGSHPYSDREILSRAGIEAGIRVNKIDRSGVERDLLREFTYLSGVKVKTGLFGRVRIFVEADTAAYYTEIAGEYFALSQDFRLLEINEAPVFESAGLIFVSLPKIKTAILGEHVAYYDATSGFVPELMEELENSELFSGISRVDASDRYDISLKYDRFQIKIGAYRDIGLKLKIASQMTKDEVLRGDVDAILDVSDTANATIRFK